MTNAEIIKNLRKQDDIERLQTTIKEKDDEILAFKTNFTENNNSDEIKQLKDELGRAKDMFLEYENTIQNLTKQKDEELKKVKIQKKKVEEEYRSAIKEKQLLKDTERILLNTFDTLKQYYDTKEKNDDTAHQRKSDNDIQGEKAKDKETKVRCNDCDYETSNRGSLRNHIVDNHHASETGRKPQPRK